MISGPATIVLPEVHNYTLEIYQQLIRGNDHVVEVDAKASNATVESTPPIFAVIKRKREKLESIAAQINVFIEEHNKSQRPPRIAIISGIICIFVGGAVGIAAGVGAVAAKVGGIVLGIGLPVGFCVCCVGCYRSIETKVYSNYRQMLAANSPLLDEIDAIFSQRNSDSEDDPTCCPTPVSLEIDKALIARRIDLLKNIESPQFYKFLSINNISELIIKDVRNYPHQQNNRLWGLLEMFVVTFKTRQTDAKNIADEMAKEKLQKDKEDTTITARTVVAPIINAYLLGDYLGSSNTSVTPPSPAHSQETSTAIPTILAPQFPVVTPITPTNASKITSTPASATEMISISFGPSTAAAAAPIPSEASSNNMDHKHSK